MGGQELGSGWVGEVGEQEAGSGWVEGGWVELSGQQL